MTELYKRDRSVSHDLLITPIKAYGETKLFTLAELHNLMMFMGHTACQTKLNGVWKGKISPYTSSWKVCNY